MTYQWRSRRPKILETHPSADVDDDDIAANVADISTDDGSQAAILRSWQDAQLDETNIYAEDSTFHSQAGASNAVDDPGGSVDDPSGSDTDDVGFFSNLATSTATSPKTSASFVSSSLTSRVSLLFLSDKSTGDVVGNVDVDCATGSFCSSCSIPPPTAGGLQCF